MPELRYNGVGSGKWRTRASEECDQKYVTVSGDNRIVDVDEKTAEKLLAIGVFSSVGDSDDSTFEFEDSDDAESDDTNADDDFDDFDAIDGVGAATEESLYDAGYTTYSDVAQSSDDELLDIDGVGETALEALRDHIGSNDNETGESAFDVGG